MLKLLAAWWHRRRQRRLVRMVKLASENARLQLKVRALERDLELARRK